MRELEAGPSPEEFSSAHIVHGTALRLLSQHPDATDLYAKDLTYASAGEMLTDKYGQPCNPPVGRRLLVAETIFEGTPEAQTLSVDIQYIDERAGNAVQLGLINEGHDSFESMVFGTGIMGQIVLYADKLMSQTIKDKEATIVSGWISFGKTIDIDVDVTGYLIDPDHKLKGFYSALEFLEQIGGVKIGQTVKAPKITQEGTKITKIDMRAEHVNGQKENELLSDYLRSLLTI